MVLLQLCRLFIFLGFPDDGGNAPVSGNSMPCEALTQLAALLLF